MGKTFPITATMLDNLKRYRKKRGLTQKQLGEKVHKSEITIRKYENADSFIPTPVLFDLMKVLDITPIEILSEEGSGGFSCGDLFDFEEFEKEFYEKYPLANTEKEIFKNDFDINLLEPRVMEYINDIKIMLKNTFPGIKFNNALIIQNIIIDRMARQNAKENADMNNPNSLMYEFSISDDTLVTGEDLYNSLYDLYYQHYKHERKEILGKRVNKILSIKECENLSNKEIDIIKEYYKDFPISSIPKQFIKYFNEEK